jgi:hypothetical protein
MCYLQIKKNSSSIIFFENFISRKRFISRTPSCLFKERFNLHEKQQWLMYIIHGSMGRKWVGHLVLQSPHILPNSHETLSKRMMMHNKSFSIINIVLYICKGYKEISTIKNI